MVLVVVQQMIIIFLLIIVGMIIYKMGHLPQEASKSLSWIVVNVTNPITMLVAALDDENKVNGKTLGMAFVYFALAYVCLGIAAYFIPVIMRVEKQKRYSFSYMTVFGNVGFIGIPFCSAVLGLGSIIYVTICGLIYNIIFYTIGTSRMRYIGQQQNAQKAKDSNGEALTDSACAPSKPSIGIRDIINTGTIMSAVTIIVYLCDFQCPVLIHSTLSYIGRCTTFISMVVLGVSVAQVSLKAIFSEKKLYAFVVLRQIMVPILLLLLLRPVIHNELMLNSIVILSAMPAANMPLMIAKQFEADESMISKGIIMTTILSVITIPIVAILM